MDHLQVETFMVRIPYGGSKGKGSAGVFTGGKFRSAATIGKSVFTPFRKFENRIRNSKVPQAAFIRLALPVIIGNVAGAPKRVA
jgi:hypothetical protein